MTGRSPDPVLPATPRRSLAASLGLVTNHAEDLGQSLDPEARFVLQWETLPANRDSPRDEPAFATTPRVHKIEGQPAHLTAYSDVSSGASSRR